MDDALLEDVKNYLNITWSDGDTDKKISVLIQSAMFLFKQQSRWGNGLYGRRVSPHPVV